MRERNERIGIREFEIQRKCLYSLRLKGLCRYSNEHLVRMIGNLMKVCNICKKLSKWLC